MDAQRRTALFSVTQDVGCASCMYDWGITRLHQTCNKQRVRLNKPCRAYSNTFSEWRELYVSFYNKIVRFVLTRYMTGICEFIIQ